jgi:hypothetical protein
MMKFLIFFPILASFGCGVKGKPLPPFSPPVLGRGEPSYSKATQGLQIDPKKKKKIQDDWEEKNDFPEDKEQ